MKLIDPSPPWKNGWKGRMKWLAKYVEQDGCCAICGKYAEPGHLTKDHIIPRSKGAGKGGNDWSNIQLACPDCNVKKGSYVPYQVDTKGWPDNPWIK